jgi:hypothetical protein
MKLTMYHVCNLTSNLFPSSSSFLRLLSLPKVGSIDGGERQKINKSNPLPLLAKDSN